MNREQRVLLLITVFGVFAVLFFMDWFTPEGEEYLGELENSCNTDYSIKFYQSYRSKEWKQDVLSFEVYRNDSLLSKKESYASTSGKDDLDLYNIHCYDSVLYVTSESVKDKVWIMVDTKTNSVYPNSGSEQLLSEEKILERIKKINGQLEYR